MKNELKNNSNSITLLPIEVKQQIVKNNYQIIFDKKIDFNKRIFMLMNMLGIPSHLSGYNYIKDALIICIENNYELPNVCKTLYPAIAKKYDKKDSQIERSIRHAINKCIDRGEPAILFQIFGYTIDNKKNIPTNKEFLAQITLFFETMCN